MAEENRKMEKIDVEEIMAGIRQEISEKGYTKEEIGYAQALANMDSDSLEKCYNKRTLRMKYNYISTHFNNPIYFELEGNPIKVFLQRVARRMFLFVIFKAFYFQNVFNEGVVDCIRQIKNYIEENEEVKHAPVKISRLEKQILEQQEQIDMLKREIQELKSKN